MSTSKSAVVRAAHAVVFLLLVCAGVSPQNAHAQYVPPLSFCVNNAGSGCYPSKVQAEAAMRSALTVGPYLELTGTSVFSSGLARYNFRVPRAREPIKTYQTGYFYSGVSLACTRADPTDPLQPDACASESEAAQNRAQQIANAQSCTLSSYELVGDWDEPYSMIRGSLGTPNGYIANNYKTLNVTMQCGSVQKTSGDYLLKRTTFTCPAGFSSVVAPIPTNATLPYVCQVNTSVTPYISGPMQQICSKPGSPHPCYPATGDKARAETDFTFAGRPFVRYYHSLNQYRGNTTLGNAWAHSYTERMDTTPYRFSPQGEYEGFVQIGSTSRYRAQNSQNRILDRFSCGAVRFRLTDGNGEIREFDENGRLSRIRNPNAPDNDVELVYGIGSLISQVVDAHGRKLTFGYTNGLLTSATLPDGTGVAYEYDTDLNLVAADYGNSQRKLYHYHETGLADASYRNYLTGITLESGERYASFGYDTYGRVISSRLHADGGMVASTTLNYVTADQVTLISENGDTQTYDMQPGIYRRILDVADSVGSDIQTYDGAGRIDTATDSAGNVTKYTYTDTYVADVIEAFGTPQERKTAYQRDTDNHLTQREISGLTGGVQTVKKIETMTYDANGRLYATCEADPAVAGSAGYACGSLADAPAGVRQTRRTFCEAADAAAPNSTCPILGLVKTVNGPRTDVADVTTFSYYGSDDPACATTPLSCPHRKGDLWKTADALGFVNEVLKYDATGRPLSTKDPNGIVTDYEYAPRGWLTAVKVRGSTASSETDDRISRMEYWPNGSIEKIVQPDGAYVFFAYDAAQRLTEIADNGNTIHYTLDSAGNRVKEDTRDPGGTIRRTLSRTYNQLGKLQSSANAAANPTDFTYDANGNIDTITDALGRVIHQDYDPLDRLSHVQQDAGGVNAETTFTHDALDRPTTVTDPKNLDTTYAYGAFDEVLSQTSPDTGTTTYTYDNAGNRITQLDSRGVTTTYAYDALNRLSSVAYSDGTPGVLYTYDAGSDLDCQVTGVQADFMKGRLARMSDGAAVTHYCYNRFGDVVGKNQVVGALSFAIRYGYGANGRLEVMSYGSSRVEYAYDTQGRVSEVAVSAPGQAPEVIAGAITYAPFGPATGWTYGNGRIMQRTFDLDYQPKTVLDSATGGLSLGYDYDAAGQLTALEDGTLNAVQARYVYDALGRLTQTQDGATATPIETYAYDATGNRTSFTNSAGTQAYTYPGSNHRLIGVAGTARTYDAAGNTLTNTAGSRTYVYNGAGRLSETKQGGVTTMHYRTNGRGERTQRFSGDPATTSVYTLYDEAGRWLADFDTDGFVLQQAVWLGDLPVGLITDLGPTRRVHYIEPDHLGTPRVVIDAVRNVAVWKWDAKGEAFGNTAPNEDPDGDAINFRFDMRLPGQRYDVASATNYNYLRDYDAQSGRYAQSDPIGLSGGITTYGYAASAPVKNIDPYGLAIAIGMYANDRNTIICDGLGGVITALLPLDEGNAKCGLGDCIEAHEVSHKNDTIRVNPNVCQGKPKGTLVQASNAEELKATEFLAHTIEIECLQKKLVQVECDEYCRAIIQDRLDHEELKRKEYE